MNYHDLMNLPYHLGEYCDPPFHGSNPIHTPHGFRGPSPIHTPHGFRGFPFPIRTPPHNYPYRYGYPYYQWPYDQWPYDQQISNSEIMENKSVIRDLEKAINGEYSAIICYQRLIAQSTNETAKKRISEIIKDEKRHLTEFSQSYFQLTKKKPVPKQSEPCSSTYFEGLQLAFNDEQETVDFYNEIADKVRNSTLKDLFRRAALDEQNHAVWFLWLLINHQ